MASLQPQDIADLAGEMTADFISKQKGGAWVDISGSSRRLQRMFCKERFGTKSKSMDNGKSLRWEVQVGEEDNFKTTEIHGRDEFSIADLFTNAEINWSFQTTNYTLDVREALAAGSKNAIINYIDGRIHAMWMNFWEKMEYLFWGAPTSSTQNPPDPYGILWWIQASTTAAFGWNGGIPSGFTDVAGISPTTYKYWNNGTGTFPSIGNAFVELAVEAMDKSAFEAPHSFKDLNPKTVRWEMCTIYDNLKKLRRLTNAHNDNIGYDVAKWMDKALINSVMVDWVPALTNSDSTVAVSNDDFLGIDWNTFDVCHWKDWHMQVSKALPVPFNQHNDRAVYLDNSCQIKCTDRMRNFRLRKAA